MHIVLIGPPGSGKGTQAPFIKERYNVCHISTGDLLRNTIEMGTPDGKKIKNLIDMGHFVPDEMILNMVGKEVRTKEACAKGYILDGIPRTVTQADRMREFGLDVDEVLYFKAPDDIIIDRTSGRWVHRASGRTYHEKYAPPKVKGVDDVTGEPLIQRNDDKREIAVKRLTIYHKETEPIINFYRNRGILATIDANRHKSDIRESITSVLSQIERQKDLEGRQQNAALGGDMGAFSVTATVAQPWWKFWARWSLPIHVGMREESFKVHH